MYVPLVLSLLSVPALILSQQDWVPLQGEPAPESQDSPTESTGPVSKDLARQLHWADFDHDQIDDALALTTEGRLLLLHSTGLGGFQDMTQAAGLASVEGASFVVVQDYDGDGLIDLFVGTRRGPSYLMKNSGAGFTDVAAASGLTASGHDWAAHWIDYDRDGLMDLHLTTDGESKLYHARGAGRFEGHALVAWATDAPGMGPAGAANGRASDPNATEGSSEQPGPRVAPGESDWSAGGGSAAPGGSSHSMGGGGFAPTSSTAAGVVNAGIASNNCFPLIADANGGSCLEASATATLGMLYPLSDRFYIDEVSGNIGVGTLSPTAGLTIGNIGSSDTYPMLGFGEGPNAGFWFESEFSGTDGNNGVSFATSVASYGEIMTWKASGNVGVGTTQPQSGLVVTAARNNAPSQAGVHLGTSTNGTRAGVEIVSASGITPVLDFLNVGQSDFGARLSYDSASDRLDLVGSNMAVTGGNLAVQAGNVGIGVSNPTSRLQVAGGTSRFEATEASSLLVGTGTRQGALSVTGISTVTDMNVQGVHLGKILYGAIDSTAVNIVSGVGGSSDLRFYDPAVTGAWRIMRASGTDTMRVDGVGLDKFSVPKLVIRGGADLVEGFETSEDRVLEPGTVVVIDAQQAGALKASDGAYDTKVAGVVSGANGVEPGIHLGQESVMDGDTKVAMTGRVYVKCSTENGAIQPGDRLTTASLAGHAMKATDGGRSDGAVLGKAMSSLNEKTGLVLVLVNLQ